MHRHVYILAGEKKWQKKLVEENLQAFEIDALWLGDNAPEKIPSVLIKKAQSWLGREKRVVVFDANETFHPDSFAAISGIVIGGGIFILLMPPENQWNEIYPTAFGQRFIHRIKSSKFINVIKQNDEQAQNISVITKVNKKENCSPPYLTYDQQYAVESILKETHNPTKLPVVLVSDRGRGKSAALGLTAARLLDSGISKMVVTAPRLRAADVVFKIIERLLPDALVEKDRITLNGSVIQFYPPDQLHQENIEADLLLIDEAASIPVPLLTSFLNKFPQCIFSTTVHGYEGTGRGFSVRFNKILNQQKPGWKKIQMKTPIRWAENDPLEQWMFNLLCLDAELVDKKEIGVVDKANIDIVVVQREDLAADDVLLHEIFSLLILAHYRTQPSDLQRLLDDEDLSIFIVKHNKHVVAIALVSHEGGFAKALSTEVYRGERRPAGHLLAQTLTYHCGIEHAATLNYSRIMRIAVHPEFQEQGIGSRLLEFIIDYEKNKGIDAIGTSFGLNLKLYNFWQKAEFNPVRIGFTREQTSGEHAAIMLRPLNHNGKIVYQQAYSRFLEQIPYWLDDILIDLPEEIKIIFQTLSIDKNTALTEFDNNDLYSFIHYSRNYELCIAAINKLIMLEQKKINNNFPEKLKEIINEKINKRKKWKQISLDMSLGGKSAARQLFKAAFIQLMDKKFK